MDKLKKFVNKYTPVIMLLPALIGVLIIQIYPSLDSIRLSFTDKSLLNPITSYVGFDNYIKALSDPQTWQTILNTLVFAVLSLALGAVFAMLVANELNKKFRGRTFFRAMFLAPWVTPPLVTSAIWQLLLSETFSPINGLLMQLGWIDKPINFLGNTEPILGFLSMPLISIIIINVWSIFPFLMVMFLAGMQTIPAEMIEAATVDGANSVQRFFKITLPCLMPVIETSILLEGIWQFNNFNISYLVTKGGPLNSTMVMAVDVYTEAFINFNYGSGATISVLMMLIILFPAVVYLKKQLRQTDNI
ncbi:Inner membrane ABC transporter permease protein ycjO [uncultured Ruminococcus sp.]|uniref:carbohydrate ABC transporter permease n=1 Tax=Massiliimalia timonensis TaxID=1987501 RepID=UPI0008231B95|nr:sugar ABC transporter permease [Massiliimalia timonensis]SCH17921.1 Inner membrane ABC transporter permease protein ycjO [uncultured Ruminococcus sp.]SCH24250.1 Inner membrane ABC transporter permease protein ycjO [uncultured Clostridium sp.]